MSSIYKACGSLSPLYSGPLWSGKRDSNPRPSAWEADALPTELFPQNVSQKLSFTTLQISVFYSKYATRFAKI